MKTDLIPENPGSIIRAREVDADCYHLSYALYRSGFTVNGEHVYSLSVTIQSLRETENAFACDVTRSRSRALSLFETISRGLVTPCTLYDILEDML